MFRRQGKIWLHKFGRDGVSGSRTELNLVRSYLPNTLRTHYHPAHGRAEIALDSVFLVANYFVTFLIIGFLAGWISLISKPKPLRISTVAEAFFSYYLLFTIGQNNLLNFVFHVFFGDMAAKFIGWENSPFQAEVGFASLGVGIAGVIALKASLPFRFATLIPPWCFSLGAAGGHIYQMIVARNFSPGNIGLVLPIDIIIPIVGLLLLWLSYNHPQPDTANRKLAWGFSDVIAALWLHAALRLHPACSGETTC